MQIQLNTNQNSKFNNLQSNTVLRKRKDQMPNSCILKSKKKNAASQLIDSKKFIEQQMANVKMIRDKQMEFLQKSREEAVKNIQDICEKYTDEFKNFRGMSADLFAILGGDVDYVTQNMQLKDVYDNLTNVQVSLITGNNDLMKEYYASGANKTQTFKDYLLKHGSQEDRDKLAAVMEGDSIDIEKINNDYTKSLCNIIDLLKGAYESVFSIDESIEKCQKDTEEQLKKLGENLKRLNDNLSKNNEALKDFKEKKEKRTQLNELV